MLIVVILFQKSEDNIITFYADTDGNNRSQKHDYS